MDRCKVVGRAKEEPQNRDTALIEIWGREILQRNVGRDMRRFQTCYDTENENDRGSLKVTGLDRKQDTIVIDTRHPAFLRYVV